MFDKKIALTLGIFIVPFLIGLLTISILDKELSDLLFSSKLNTFVSVSMYFFYTFFILRLRDVLLNTKFPIETINSNPLSASIYYSSSILAVFIGTAIIIS